MINNFELKDIYDPEKVVEELDKYIIGQNEAKKSVAISLRNRYRRMKINKNMLQYVIPKNILMIGSTGVGKTEIARRLSIIYNAPFIKVEATRFTEVGYVGKDVESIIRDLVDISLKIEKKQKKLSIDIIATQQAEKKIISILLNNEKKYKISNIKNNTYKILKKKLNEGFFNDKEIEITINNNKAGVEIMTPPGMEEITKQLQSLLNNVSANKKKKQK